MFTNMQLLFKFCLLILVQFVLNCDCKSWNGGLTIQVSNSLNQDCYFLEAVQERFYVSIDYQVCNKLFYHRHWVDLQSSEINYEIQSYWCFSKFNLKQELNMPAQGKYAEFQDQS